MYGKEEIVMKKTNILFSAAFAVFVMVSCSKDIIDNKDTVQQPNLVPMTFSVAESVEETATDSKTTLVIVDNKKTINWVANDKVGVFGVVNTSASTINTNNQEFCAQSNGPTTSLTGQVFEGDNKFYAFCPYQESVELDLSGTYPIFNKVKIPVQQKAIPNSFDPSAYVLTAQTQVGKTDLTFYPGCSLITFKMKGAEVAQIKSIRLSSNGRDILATEDGSITVYSAAANLNATTGTNYVELLLGSDESFQANVEYNFVIRRVKCGSGISVYVEYKDGTVIKRAGTNAFDASDYNCIKSLGTLDLDGESFTKLTYSEAFELGYNVIVGDKVYNKNNTTTYSSLNATTETVNLNSAAYKAGLYFLKGENFTLNGSWNVANDVVLIGDTDGVKFKVDPGKYIYHNSKSLRIKNIDITILNTNYCLVNNSTSTDATELVFDDCSINSSCPVFYTSSDSGCAVGSIIVSNTSIEMTGSKDLQMFNLLKASNSKITDISFTNCNFKSSANTRIVNLPAWASGSTTSPSLVFNNNTFDAFIPYSAILYCNGEMSSITASGNTGSVVLPNGTSYFIYNVDGQENITFNNPDINYSKSSSETTAVSMYDYRGGSVIFPQD